MKQKTEDMIATSVGVVIAIAVVVCLCIFVISCVKEFSESRAGLALDKKVTYWLSSPEEEATK